MVKNTNDTRVQKTERILKQNMLQLLKKKPLNEIKVSELCKLCELNRTTFYGHYQDLYGLVEEMENDLLSKFSELSAKFADSRFSSEQVVREILAFLRQNQEALKIFLSNDTQSRFLKKCTQLVLPFFEQKVRQHGKVTAENEAQLRSLLRFLTAGYYSLYYEYLGSADHNDETILLATKISTRFLEAFWE